MTAIGAAAVKELRTMTGVGMMDCKQALIESGGDMEAARDWLRAKGLSKAARKSGRAAAEGLIGLAVSGRRAALVEVNSETDFVARNASFQALVTDIAGLVLERGADVAALLDSPSPKGDGTLSEVISALVGNIGENIRLRRASVLTVDRGAVSGYVHAPITEGLGRIGAIVAIEGDGDGLAETARKLAMHVAAAAPVAVSREELDPGDVARERRLQLEQASAKGRPPDVTEKIVEGRLRKYFEEIVLEEQKFVMDDKRRVGEVVEAAHPGARIRGFALLRLGEGVETAAADFAEEVERARGGA